MISLLQRLGLLDQELEPHEAVVCFSDIFQSQINAAADPHQGQQVCPKVGRLQIRVQARTK